MALLYIIDQINFLIEKLGKDLLLLIDLADNIDGEQMMSLEPCVSQTKQKN